MSNWSGWDWISYGCLGLAAFGLAFGSLSKEYPEMLSSLPSLFSSPKWAAAPALLFVVATIIFIARLFAAETQSPLQPRLQTANVQLQHLIKDPRLEWDEASGRVSLHGRYSQPGGPLNVYVTYEHTNVLMSDRRPSTVLSGTGTVEPQIKLDSVLHFDEGETADITLGFISGEGLQRILQWGTPQQNKTKIGVSVGNYFVNIILVWSDGKSKDSVPFAVVSTYNKRADPIPPPILIGPDLLLAQQQRGQAK
jgi:hypothetical protein